MKTNTSTSEEDYDCGKIEHYENDCLEKLLRVIKPESTVAGARIECP